MSEERDGPQPRVQPTKDAGERNPQEGFLGRWSRLKRDAREAPPPSATPAAEHAEDPPPELPPIDSLTMDSDFRAFLHPKVDEDVRRSALRKLFSDPHFNVMDGLDVYIDDYSKTEPIPAAMLASLKQAQRIFDWAAGKDDEAAESAEGNTEPAAAVPEVTAPQALPEANAKSNTEAPE